MNFKKILKSALVMTFIFVAHSNAAGRVVSLPAMKPLTINQIIGNLKAGVFKQDRYQKSETLYSILCRWWHVQDKKEEKNKAKINPAFIAMEIWR